MIFLSAMYITIKSNSYLSHQQLIFFPLRCFKQNLSLFLHKIQARQYNPSVMSSRWPHICNKLNTLKYFIFFEVAKTHYIPIIFPRWCHEPLNTSFPSCSMSWETCFQSFKHKQGLRPLFPDVRFSSPQPTYSLYSFWDE